MHYPFSDHVYDLLCWLGRSGLPALATFVVAIGAALGHTQEAAIVAAVITATITMFNSLTTESKKKYVAQAKEQDK